MARRRTSRKNARSKRGVRRILKNFLGSDIVRDVVSPVLSGTVGFVATRVAGNIASRKISLLADPRYGKVAAAAVLIPAYFVAQRSLPSLVSGSMANAAVIGAGLAASESFIRNMPMLGGSPSAAILPAVASAPATAAPTATAGYYNEGMLSGMGRGYDISHAGAPYKGMLGLGTMYAAAGIGEYVDQPMSGLGDSGDGISGIGDLGEPGDQGAVDSSMNRMEAVTTITPTDGAIPMQSRPQVRRVSKSFASGDQGYAGGVFARHIFSGMLG